MRAHLMKPISSARSRKQRRQIMRPYLRMRPWCAPHTRLSAQTVRQKKMKRKRERKKSFFFSSSSFSLCVCGAVRDVPAAAALAHFARLGRRNSTLHHIGCFVFLKGEKEKKKSKKIKEKNPSQQCANTCVQRRQQQQPSLFVRTPDPSLRKKQKEKKRSNQI